MGEAGEALQWEERAGLSQAHLGVDTRTTVTCGPTGWRPQGSHQIPTASANLPGFDRQPSSTPSDKASWILETAWNPKKSGGAFKAGLFVFLENRDDS